MALYAPTGTKRDDDDNLAGHFFFSFVSLGGRAESVCMSESYGV